MKVKDLCGILTEFTNVKIVVNGDEDVFKGYFYQVPVKYAECEIENLIPIKHPDNHNLGMAAIIIKYEE